MPYAWHSFMIGVSETSAVMMQPYLADSLLQAVDEDLRQVLVQQLVDFLQGADKGTPWAGEVGDKLRHWLSRAG